MPVPPRAVTSSAVSSIVPGRPRVVGRPRTPRPVTYTVAPRSPSTSATPLPHPRLAPVTSATVPSPRCMAADRTGLTRQNLSGIVGIVRASRLVALLLLLQARGRMTAAGLASELEVSPRTIQRDVEALAAAGVPVYSERGRDGGYRLVGGYRSRLTGLDPDEARALVAVGTAAPARELGLGQALMSARLKLIASLPAGLRDEMSAAAGRVHLAPPGGF